jgi:hypothetical protein
MVCRIFDKAQNKSERNKKYFLYENKKAKINSFKIYKSLPPPKVKLNSNHQTKIFFAYSIY